MKSKKQLFEFFLQKVGLWNQFIADNILVWSYIDDDLTALEQYYHDRVHAKQIPQSMRQLWNPDYLEKLVADGVLADCALMYALSDLAEYAGLNAFKVGEMLQEKDSVMRIVEKIHSTAVG